MQRHRVKCLRLARCVRKDGFNLFLLYRRMPLNKNPDVSGASTKKLPPLPGDMYQVQVLDVEEREGTAYGSGQPEMQLNFKLAVLDDGPYYGRFLFATCSRKFVGGSKPSNLFSLISALTSRQFTKEEMQNPSAILTADFLNKLIGEQVRVTLIEKDRANGEGKTNKITTYMSKKQDLPGYDEDKAKKVFKDSSEAQAGGVNA